MSEKTKYSPALRDSRTRFSLGEEGIQWGLFLWEFYLDKIPHSEACLLEIYFENCWFRNNTEILCILYNYKSEFKKIGFVDNFNGLLFNFFIKISHQIKEYMYKKIFFRYLSLSIFSHGQLLNKLYDKFTLFSVFSK